MFLAIVGIIVGGQIIMITFGGEAMKLVTSGLDAYGWLICILVGSIGWVISFALKIIPFDLLLPQYGQKEIEKDLIGRHSALSIRKLPSLRYQLGKQMA